MASILCHTHSPLCYDNFKFVICFLVDILQALLEVERWKDRYAIVLLCLRSTIIDFLNFCESGILCIGESD